MSTSIRALLIDDEVLARLALRQALATHADVEIVGECGNADEALRAIEALAPDILFLDIRMPGMDGFKLLRGLSPDALPLVVFTTAYGEHALRAFDAGATDYVLKPLDQNRFDQALSRVRERRAGLQTHAKAAKPAVSPKISAGYPQRIGVSVGEHTRIIPTADIDFVRARGNYLEIHIDGKRFLRRGSLRRLLASLDPSRFLRIHRSIAVNVDRIRELRTLSHGNAEVILADGSTLPLSRRFSAITRSMLDT